MTKPTTVLNVWKWILIMVSGSVIVLNFYIYQNKFGLETSPHKINIFHVADDNNGNNDNNQDDRGGNDGNDADPPNWSMKNNIAKENIEKSRSYFRH